MQLQKIGELDSLVSAAFSAGVVVGLRQLDESCTAARLYEIGFGLRELQEAGCTLGELLAGARTWPRVRVGVLIAPRATAGAPMPHGASPAAAAGLRFRFAASLVASAMTVANKSAGSEAHDEEYF